MMLRTGPTLVLTGVLAIMRIYLLLSVLAGVGIAVAAFAAWRAGQRPVLTTQVSLALSCVLAGILFGADRWIGYSLIGVGVAFALLALRQRAKTGAV